MSRKKGNGEGAIRKRNDGTWEGRITIGINPNGTQKRKSHYGKTRQIVSAKMTKTMHEINMGTYIEPVNITVGRWLDQWMDEYKRHSVKPTTLGNYSRAIKNHIKPAIGRYQLKNLRTGHIQKLVNDMLDNDFAPQTIKGVYNIIHGALRQAVYNDLIIKNVASPVTLPPIKQKEVEVLTPEEQDKFIQAAKEVQTGELFIFAIGTGLRKGELLGLKWSDINFEDKYVSVKRTVSKIQVEENGKKTWKNVAGSVKSESSQRDVPLLPVMIELLEEYKLVQQGYKDIAGVAYEDDDIILRLN